MQIKDNLFLVLFNAPKEVLSVYLNRFSLAIFIRKLIPKQLGYCSPAVHCSARKIILKDKNTESGGCRFHQAYIPKVFSKQNQALNKKPPGFRRRFTTKQIYDFSLGNLLSIHWRWFHKNREWVEIEDATKLRLQRLKVQVHECVYLLPLQQ